MSRFRSLETAPTRSFYSLLKNASVLVHHGGVGTTSFALASGIPQVTSTNMNFGTWNARAMQRLGVGLTVHWYRQLPAAIERVFRDGKFLEQSQAFAKRFPSTPEFGPTIDSLEQLLID